jgi:large subunit ribosomal protein L29
MPTSHESRGRTAPYAELSDAELVHKVLQAERDLVGARFKHSLNQLENTARLGVLRRDIARMRTATRTRELESGLEKGKLLTLHRATFGGKAASSEAPAAEKGGFLSGIVDKLTGKD